MQLPGREIRVRAGDVVEATLTNRLPADTTIHWHGVALRNDRMASQHSRRRPSLPVAASFTGSSLTPRALTGFTRTPGCSSTAACMHR